MRRRFLTRSCALTTMAVLSPRLAAAQDAERAATQAATVMLARQAQSCAGVLFPGVVIGPLPGILVGGLVGRQMTRWDRRYPL